MQFQPGSRLQTPKRTQEEVQRIPGGGCLDPGAARVSAPPPPGILANAGMEPEWGQQLMAGVWAKATMRPHAHAPSSQD